MEMNEKVTKEQLNALRSLVNSKDIDNEALERYLKTNNLSTNLSELSLEEFGKLYKLIDAPDIKIGDTITLKDNFPGGEKLVDKNGIVLSVYRNEYATGKLLNIKNTQNGVEGIQLCSESWVEQVNPFVELYGGTRNRSDDMGHHKSNSTLK